MWHLARLCVLRSQARQNLLGEGTHRLSRLTGILGLVGPLDGREPGRILQGMNPGDHLGEALVVRILLQPAMILVIDDGGLVLHVDEHAKVLGKPHLGVELFEPAEDLQPARRDVVWLGRRDVEVGLA